ncbi:MAG: xanthine dehydrogenase family protein molybdopterin-binding subunit, partial [Acidimicrobiales bacterium]
MADQRTQTSGLGFVGQSVPRIEDERLLVGEGTFVADIDPPGALHAAFVRSPFPHARITRIDVAAAEALPGVVKVFTGADIKAKTLPFPPFAMLPNLYTPPFWAMSDDKVRMVGDPVALVLAESRYLAEDGAELVEVDYEPLDPVATIERALDPSSAQLWGKADGNLLYDTTDTFSTTNGAEATEDEVGAVFANADRVVTERFACHRQSNQPMETRGAVIEVDPTTGDLTVHNATQSGHFLRWILAGLTEPQGSFRSLFALVRNSERRKAFLSGARAFLKENGAALQESDNAGPLAQFRRDRGVFRRMVRMGTALLAKDRHITVKAADVGGAFGSKGAIAREDVALAVAAIELGRSVKWIEDRVENLTDGGQAREEEMEVSIALDDDGTFRGLKVDLVIDQGAYPGFPVGATFTTRIMKLMWPGAYRWDAFQLRSRIVATNKGKYIAYRGPWANETWVRERIIDLAARELGMSPTEIRMKNMIGEVDMPTEMITGPTIDETMSTRKTLEKAVELMDPAGFEQERAAAAADGRLLGIGFASYHEAAPGPPNYITSINPGTEWAGVERASASVEADGSIVVRTSQFPHGQS